MPERVYISIGSNIEPERHLRLAVDRLRALGDVVAVSSVYESPAVAATPQPDFLNAAVLIETTLSPVEIRARLRAIEVDLGRARGSDTHAPRTIDLDMCLYGDLVSCSPELTLPHPDIGNYAFVAAPLAELTPEFRHPVQDVSLAELSSRLSEGAALVRRSDVDLSAGVESEKSTETR